MNPATTTAAEMSKKKETPTTTTRRAMNAATAAEIRALKAELRAELIKLREAHKATAREYYTVKEAAEFLQVRPGTIYQYIARGWIRKQPTPGPRVWISHSELTRYMNGEPIPPDEPPAG